MLRMMLGLSVTRKPGREMFCFQPLLKSKTGISGTALDSREIKEKLQSTSNPDLSLELYILSFLWSIKDGRELERDIKMLIHIIKNPFDYYVTVDGELIGTPQQESEVKAFLRNAQVANEDIERFDTHQFEESKAFACDCLILPPVQARWF